MDSFYIIAGLGNPGLKYDGTRHNVGFKVIDELADRSHIDRPVRFGKSLIGKGVIGGEKVILVKPLTYMNLSGEAVREICSYYKADPADHLIVISDDVDLPVGHLRIRKKGSAGGHNGLKNITLAPTSLQGSGSAWEENLLRERTLPAMCSAIFPLRTDRS